MFLPDEQLTILNRMLSTIQQKRRRNLLRSRYVDGKKTLDRIGFSVPPHMTDFATVLGWPEKSFMVPARRVRPDGFTVHEPTELFDELSEIFFENDIEAAERLAVQASMKHGISFVFTSAGDVLAGEPETLITVRSALQASAEIDPRTRRASAAVEVIDRNTLNLYLPGQVLYCTRKSGGRWWIESVFETTPNWVACTPYIWGETLERPTGKSLVSRTVMSLTDIAVRVLLRQEVSAEFFSAPQRYLLGADENMFVGENGEPRTGWEAVIGAMLVAPDVANEDDELKRVSVGQFPQMSQQPHTDHLRTIAMMFSGETSIPSNSLGIIFDANPQSADAITALDADLVTMVEDGMVGLRSARTALARDVLAVRYGEWTEGMARDLRGLRAHYKNPATPSLMAQADAMVKLATVERLKNSDVLLEIGGFSQDQIDRINRDNQRAQAGSRLESLVAAARSIRGGATGGDLGASAGVPSEQPLAS